MELQEADPRAVRRAAALVAATALLGAAAVLLWELKRPAVEAWMFEDPARAGERLRLALGLLGLAGGLPLLVFAAYCWRFGTAVLRSGRFPPPGATVVRDAWVLTGTEAQRRGRMIHTFARVLLAIAVTMPVVLWQIGRMVVR